MLYISGDGKKRKTAQQLEEEKKKIRAARTKKSKIKK
jgi:hypothetical protein